MRDLISSMVRFSSAMTMFGVEQAQNAMMAPSDTQAALSKLRETLDAMADTLAAKMDESKRAALDSMSRAQSDIVERTLEMVDLDMPGEFIKRTSASLSDLVKRPGAAAE